MKLPDWNQNWYELVDPSMYEDSQEYADSNQMVALKADGNVDRVPFVQQVIAALYVDLRKKKRVSNVEFNNLSSQKKKE